MERGARAFLWVGSANATKAAFGGNVEVLAELEGPRSRCGVDAILASRKGMTSFVDLLQPYQPPQTPDEENGDLARVEGWFDETRRALLAAPVTARVSPGDTGGHALALVLADGATIAFPEEVEVTCWPITLAETRGARTIRPGARGVIADFGGVTFEALTTFYAFRLRASSGRATETTSFVLSLRLEGEPSDRAQRILKSLLKDRHAVLRYLLLILAPAGMDILPPTSGKESDNGDPFRWSVRGPGLLERLLGALVGSPSRREEVARLLKDLDSDSGGRDLLPEGFKSVWAPVWRAYQESRK